MSGISPGVFGCGHPTGTNWDDLNEECEPCVLKFCINYARDLRRKFNEDPVVYRLRRRIAKLQEIKPPYDWVRVGDGDSPTKKAAVALQEAQDEVKEKKDELREKIDEVWDDQRKGTFYELKRPEWSAM